MPLNILISFFLRFAKYLAFIVKLMKIKKYIDLIRLWILIADKTSIQNRQKNWASDLRANRGGRGVSTYPSIHLYLCEWQWTVANKRRLVLYALTPANQRSVPPRVFHFRRGTIAYRPVSELPLTSKLTNLSSTSTVICPSINILVLRSHLNFGRELLTIPAHKL